MSPFRALLIAFMWLILLICKIKKRNVKTKRTEAGKLTLALTGNSYLSKIQHFTTSTVGFELLFHTQSPQETSVMV